jgi:hypothetical protein
VSGSKGRSPRSSHDAPGAERRIAAFAQATRRSKRADKASKSLPIRANCLACSAFGGGQVRSLLDKRVGTVVTVGLTAGALRSAKSLWISSRIAFS